MAGLGSRECEAGSIDGGPEWAATAGQIGGANLCGAAVRHVGSEPKGPDSVVSLNSGGGVSPQHTD